MSLSSFWRVFWFRYHGIIAALILGANFVSAQTTRTWNGSTSSDWFQPTNWIPNGVPAANDIINVTNGTINLTAPVAISNQFYWSGGTLSGSALTIASNAVMTINTVNTLLLENVLTNGGTVIWSNNAGGLSVLNNGGAPFAGLIANAAGALWDIQCDQSLYSGGAIIPYFYNAGTLRKSTTSGTTTFQLLLINSGSVSGLQGTLSFSGGGPLNGTFTAGSGASMNFGGNAFTNSGPVSMNGPGSFQLISGNLWLMSDAIANLVLAGGSVNLGPAFQGGTITNLTIAGATLAGTNTVTGTFNWTGGVIAGGALTIAHSGVMNIGGNTVALLESPLTNSGTVNWTNHSDLNVLNNNGVPYAGLIENLSGGLFDIQSDQNIYNNAGNSAYFHNLGTLRKSALTGATSFSLPLINSGSVTDLQGTLDFGGGGPLSGTFTAGPSGAINFTGGNLTNSGPVSMNGPGPIQMFGASLFLLADTITNFPLTGGTVYLGSSFQGGTITNLTIAGVTLAGTNTVTGTFNWNNGTIAGGPMTIAPGGVMNIGGNTTLFLENPLTNAGTVNWNDAGDINVLNNNGAPYSALIENLPGAVFDIQSERNIFNNAGGPAYFHNAGLLEKTAHAGATSFALPLTNSATVSGLNGNLVFNGGGVISGTFNAAAGAEVTFASGNYTNFVPVMINGPGVVQFYGGGILALLTNTIPNLVLGAGTVYLGPAFQGGTITNFTISGATLGGTNTVTGTFNWNNGTIAGGPLTVAGSGVMNINGTTTMFLESPLTNAGTVNWTNIGELHVLNNNGIYAGLIENLPGALFDIQCDQSMYNNGGGNAYFHNAGTLQKSALTGFNLISIPVTNSGTLSTLSGKIGLYGGFTPIGGSMLFGLSSPTSFGTVTVNGNATLGGTVGVLWLNGFVPANGNSFTVLNYGSFTGIFTNFTSPTGPLWLTNYTSTAFTLSVASINQLAFTTPPVEGVINAALAPIVVQIEDPGSNAVPTGGIPITMSLNSGSGSLKGTLIQSTDSSGKATFGDLSLSATGTKTLRAASASLTTAISVPFDILPLIGLQLTNGGVLIQLNGTNSLAPVTIYASTNLGNSFAWAPIYTNAPTNGPIKYLDTAATNLPVRFYHIK